MALGLGAGLGKGGIIGSIPGVVTDNLVMKHMYPAGAVQPLSDGAVDLNGSSAAVDTNSNFSTTFINSFSIACWVKMIDGRNNVIQTICGYDNSSGQDKLLIDLPSDSSGDLRVFFAGDNDGIEVTSTSPVFINGMNEWIHICIVVTEATTMNEAGGAIKLYVDGIDTAVTYSGSASASMTGSNMSNFSSDVDLYIGARNTYSTIAHYLKGYICNFGIFNVALTQPQIKSIMWKQYTDLTSTESGYVLSWYALDTNANDSTGTNNGALV